MNNFRVIVSGNSGDGFSYRIEDIYTGMQGDVLPFVEHRPYGVCCATSVEELKKRLEELLEACDKPVMYLTAQELKERR